MSETVKVLDIRKDYYSDFSAQFSPSSSYLQGVRTVFNNPNEPEGDMYARSGVVIYPRQYEILYETEQKDRNFILIEKNPRINIGDIITISLIPKMEILANITQQNMRQNFLKQYDSLKEKYKVDKSKTLGLILHVSYDKQIYMPGYGCDAKYKEIDRGMYNVSLSSETDILAVDYTNRERREALTCYGAIYVVPGDVVVMDGKYIGRLITNINTTQR